MCGLDAIVDTGLDGSVALMRLLIQSLITLERLSRRHILESLSRGLGLGQRYDVSTPLKFVRIRSESTHMKSV